MYAKLYGSLKLIFPESLREIQHRPPDIAVHPDYHLAGDLVNVDLVQNLGRLVLLVVFVLEETTHQVPDSSLRLRIVLIIVTGEYVLHGDDDLSISPLPYLHLAYRSAAFEIETTDLALGKLDQAEQQTLRIYAEVMADR